MSDDAVVRPGPSESTRPEVAQSPSDHQSLHSDEEASGATSDDDAARHLGRIERVIRRVDRFQQEHISLGFPFAVVQKFGNDQAGGKAALIAYYGLFALFPLLLLFATILGYALHDNQNLQKDLIDSALGNFPIIGSQLQSHTHGLRGNSFAVVIGSVLLLYGAVGLGLATQSAMNTVWNIPYVRWPSLYLRYLRALVVLALLALSTIGSTVLTGFATLVSHGQAATGLLLVGSLALNFCLILLAFRVMTADPLTWRDVALGAALATAFWQSLQLIGSWYVGHELRHATSTYGFFGIVIVLLTWIFLGAQLFLLAAEINVVKRYRLWPRSMTQPPLTGADRLVFERLARMELRRPEVRVEIGFLPEADHDPMELTPASAPHDPSAR
ncbi:MAG: YihY/virulence factor BrkB family protein [Acidimicrobiales bacterium]